MHRDRSVRPPIRQTIQYARGFSGGNISLCAPTNAGNLGDDPGRRSGELESPSNQPNCMRISCAAVTLIKSVIKQVRMLARRTRMM
jgi:hypothetical protein